jgi:anti-sigma B factor antagonist
MSPRAQIIAFTLQRIIQGDVQVVSIAGHMGNDEVCRVDTELAPLLQQGHRRVVLDLATLSSATAMSLARLFVCAQEFQRHGGQLKLAALSPRLRHIAELVGFDKKRDFQPDVAVALEAFRRLEETKAASPRKKK